MKPSDPGRLIIVCGLPGSGKTTLAQSLEAKLLAVRLSADDWMNAIGIDLWDEEKRAHIETLQWAFGQRLLQLGVVVIVEWGTWARSERDVLRLGARALGAYVELHFLSASPDVLFDRIQRRNMENPPIQREVVTQWVDSFEEPTKEELALYDPPLVTGLDAGASI